MSLDDIINKQREGIDKVEIDLRERARLLHEAITAQNSTANLAENQPSEETSDTSENENREGEQ